MHDEDFFLDNHYLEDTEIRSGQLQLRKCRDISHANVVQLACVWFSPRYILKISQRVKNLR